jgi:hypothetical protein
MAGGVKLEYTSADVPVPPAPSFAQDIPGLVSMWDDHWAEWKNNSYLRLRNTFIPLVYWKEVYTARQKGADPAHWKLLKQRWSEWKVCGVSLSSSVV